MTSSSNRGSRRAATALALGSVLALTATACGDDGSGSAGIVEWQVASMVMTTSWWTALCATSASSGPHSTAGSICPTG
ncbi:hypothetical protein SRB17_13070 [Streptomyces sp. RB17]|uniref:hypothetical protein n=1 Tax=Streptomyces sp. RB17 TaxID=2585197 RepID=UPI0012953B91|nr:hypothetical protein [Streptomyces sp. RB17]MQY33346.1 hypothetical protein [Streptomyces sp. RB17]